MKRLAVAGAVRAARGVGLFTLGLALTGCLEANPPEQPADGKAREVVSARADSQLASVPGVTRVGVVPSDEIMPPLDVGLFREAPLRSVASTLIAPPGTLSVASSWRAVWSEQGLFFYVHVSDAYVVSDSPFAWEDDSVEIYVDGDGRGGATYDANDYQLVFRAGGDRSVQVGARSATDTRGLVHSVLQFKGGYMLLVGIPWTMLGFAQGGIEVGARIGLDVHVNDDDDGGGRDAKIATYASADVAWQTPSVFGTSELEDYLHSGLRVRGSVLREGDARPIQGATVQVVCDGCYALDVTDAHGDFTLSSCVGGEFTLAPEQREIRLRIDAPGYVGRVVPLEFEEPHPLACDELFWGAALARKTADVPRIDGVPSLRVRPDLGGLWAQARSYSLEHVLFDAGVGRRQGGQWKVVWNDQALFFYAQIADDVIVADSQDAWEDDSVEFYIDPNGSGGGSYDAHDYQIVVRPSDGAIQVGARSATDLTGVEHSVQVDHGVYEVALVVPWRTLDVVPLAWDAVRFDVHVNDDDDGGARDGKLATFAPSDDAWTNPSAFGQGVLSPVNQTFYQVP